MRAGSATLFLATLSGCGLVLDLDARDRASPIRGGRDGGVAEAGAEDASVDAVVADAGLVRPDPCGGLSCLQDGFGDMVHDPVWREYSYSEAMVAEPGSAVEAGGVLTITAPTGVVRAGYGYVSEYAYDARGDRASVHVVRVADAPAQTYLALRYGTEELVVMIYQLDTLILARLIGDTVLYRNDVSPFVPTERAWWQLRIEGGRLFFDTATDGTDFAPLGDIEAPEWSGAAHLELGVNTQNEIVERRSADFDDVNLAPGRTRMPYCPIDQPTDDFEDGTIDPYLWVNTLALRPAASCTITESDGAIAVSGVSTDMAPCGLLTRHAYDLAFGVFVHRSAGSPSDSLLFGVQDAARREVFAACYGAELYVVAPDGTPSTFGPCPEEEYWRFVLAGDQVELGVADVMGAWRTAASVPRGALDASVVRAGFGLAPAGAESVTSVDGFNVP